MKHFSPAAMCVALVLSLCLPALHAEPASVITRIMQAADKNKDSKLSLAEYLPLDVQATHHGEEHFKVGDTSHDGFLDVTELTATLQKQTWFAILTEGTEACFARLDADKNGKLDVTEYRKISRMGHHAEQHFKHADTDNDGFLSLAEFTTHAEEKLKALGESSKRKF